jgi:copper chaperone CopZ
MVYRRIHFICVVAVCLGCEQAVPPSETTAVFNATGAPVIEFSVPDMMCAEGCGVAVKEILARQPGVTDVLVDFDVKVATVAIEEGKFNADKALAALVDRQFTNSSLKGDAAAKP